MATVTFNREFGATLKRYAELSKKDPATICNNKSYRILKSATYKMPKSTRAEIRDDLMKVGDLGAPIAALLVNKQRRAAGLPGLIGAAMRKAVEKLIKRRRIATLRAGNVAAMKALSPYVDRAVSAALERITFGKDKGYAKPASSNSWSAETKFGNTAGAKWDTRGSGTPKSIPAWQQAFDEERADMQVYIERKLRETAKQAGIKTN